MKKVFLIFCFCSAFLAAAQISTPAQDCIVGVQTGNPSKLVEAVHANKFEEFKQLIKDGEDVNAFHYDYETAVMATITYERIEFLKELVKAKADVDKTFSGGNTPLITASRRTLPSEEYVRILLAAGADVNAENKDGWTALLAAARDGNLPTIEILLNAGANLHHQNKLGYTAFLLSAEGGHAENLQKFLELGFDPNSYSTGGYTALVGAARYPELLKILLRAGTKPNLQIPTGGLKSMTALEVAAQNGWTESVKILLEAGADPNLYYSPDRLPLDKALQKNYTEIIELLTANGAKRWQDR